MARCAGPSESAAAGRGQAIVFNVTDDERAGEQLRGEKLATIAQEIASTGYAVVEGLVSPETCELLLNSVVEDAGAVKAQ